MVIRRVRLACDGEPCSGACCSNVFASSVNVEVLGVDDVRKRELSLSFCSSLGTWLSTVLRSSHSACDEVPCLSALCSDVFASSGNVEVLGCDDALRREPSSGFCCSLGT